MNKRIVNMLEGIKDGTYTAYTDYLNDTDIEKIYRWFHCNKIGNKEELENAINLMYELYIREGLDAYEYVEYEYVISKISDKYNINKSCLLNIYSAFKKLVFED